MDALRYWLNHSARCPSGGRGVLWDKLEDFKAVAENVLQDPDLKEAFSLVRQALHILESGTEDLLQKSQQLGTTIHTDMKLDAQLWNSCDEKWRRGPRDRVSEHHHEWFADDSDRIRAQALVELVERE